MIGRIDDHPLIACHALGISKTPKRRRCSWIVNLEGEESPNTEENEGLVDLVETDLTSP